MAEENVPAQAPTRTDEQILPHSAWLQIGKSNLLLDLQKMQNNPIFHVSVDILRNSNFFRAFTASSSVHAIYIQQFRNTMTYDAKTRVYSVQLDEQWFTLSVELLRKALEITSSIQLIPLNHLLLASLKKTTPLLIPYYWFTKLIIYYLGSKHNIHRRPESAVHVMGDDYLIGNLKFVPKGEKDKVFGMTIPKHLITEAIQQSPYYQQYLGKPSLKLSDEEEEVQHEPEPQDEKTYVDLERALKLSLDSSQPQGQIEDEDADLELALKMSLDSFQAQSQGPVRGATIHVEVQRVDKEQGEEALTTAKSEDKIEDSTEDQAGSDPGKDHEALARSDPEPMQMTESIEDQAGSGPRKGHEALARTNPKPMHKDFYTTAYPDVHKILKLRTDENVILEEPTSQSRTLSSMKNLDDTDNFGDDFLNDIPTENDQANTSTPLLSTTTTLAQQPPPPTQSSTYPELVARVVALERRNAELEHAFTVQHKTTKNLASRIITLENHGIQATIENYVCETIKEKVQIALRAPLLLSFRDISEAEMKEILHQRMFESGSYKSHSDHDILYNALELSMDRDHQDELREELPKSRKRRCDDQDPPPPSNDEDQDPPPPKDSEQNKKKRLDSDASTSTQPPAHISLS
uniref:E-beta-farnesene synthase n=1 Tax=Tanacetum cinerariifolium TaxID=118510 RepID=A0A699I248_TANCI|nr:E-beta-farnesene synthase [Tanacetum cinerariifolium]GEZ58266.1 E-beta-farnesene synthase [Tanacetum cinerariifolium]